jgi:4-diphosphocytidyl-2-C-methyl-D-erythritol kinase
LLHDFTFPFLSGPGQAQSAAAYRWQASRWLSFAGNRVSFIDYSDTVELAVRDDGVIELLNPVRGAPEQDLTVRAARLLQRETGSRLGASIRLSKHIPMGGGLGGGSSDAATVLLALNHLWQTNCSREKLMELGLQLGADVPVFIFGKNALATGIGEKLNEINLKPAWYVVIHPGVHVPTAEIFKKFAGGVDRRKAASA